MAVRSARGLIVVLAVCCLASRDGRLFAADSPATNGKPPLKTEILQPQPGGLNSQPGPSGTANLPPADNDLGLLAAPKECEGEPCGRGIFCGECCCGDPGRVWLRGDYLIWWTRGANLPPLVTTSPDGTVFSQAGILPAAQVLFGGTSVNGQGRSGWRVTMGGWLNCGRTWGLEGDYYDLAGNSTNFTAASNPGGLPILARPVFDINPAPVPIIGTPVPPGQSSQLVSFFGPLQVGGANVPYLAGRVSVNASDFFQSAGLHVRHALLCTEQSCIEADGEDARRLRFSGPGCSRLDLIAGYRYYRLNDSVTIREQLQGLFGGPLAFSLFDVLDDFRARNDFHGGELGLVLQTYRGPWSLELLMKAALGNNHQTVDINGFTAISVGPAVQQYVGGVYALGTNIGTYGRDDFVIIPQLGLEAGYQLTSHLRAYVGYNLLYWATVARAGDQINQTIDSAQIPNSHRNPIAPFPAFTFQETSFWAQGINTGLELRY